MSRIIPGGETEPHFIPRILNNREGDQPVPGVTPLRLELVPSGLTVVLTQPELTLGRHSDCDVRLPLPDVSRHHCRLLFQGGRWWLLDLHSLNGVFINDQRVQAKQLLPNDRLRIGGFTFLVDPAANGTASRKRELLTEAERTVLNSIAAVLAGAPLEHRRAS